METPAATPSPSHEEAASISDHNFYAAAAENRCNAELPTLKINCEHIFAITSSPKRQDFAIFKAFDAPQDLPLGVMRPARTMLSSIRPLPWEPSRADFLIFHAFDASLDLPLGVMRPARNMLPIASQHPPLTVEPVFPNTSQYRSFSGNSRIWNHGATRMNLSQKRCFFPRHKIGHVPRNQFFEQFTHLDSRRYAN